MPKIIFVRLILLLFAAYLITFTACRCDRPDTHRPAQTPHGQKSDENHSPFRTKDETRLQPNRRESAQELLARMVRTYKQAGSYSDHGRVHPVGESVADTRDLTPVHCAVAWEKANNIRLEIGEGTLVCHNGQCHARLLEMPDQLLGIPVQEPISLEFLFQDPLFAEAAELGIPRTVLAFPPQLILLFAKDPIKTFLPTGATANLLPPQWLNNTACDLVRISDAQGVRILWIGRENSLLLRFDYLVEGLAVANKEEVVRMIRIEMGDARINCEINPLAFQMMVPGELRSQMAFEPPEVAMTGQRIELTNLFPLSGPAENNALKPDRTSILAFWEPHSDPAGHIITQRNELAKRFAEDKTLQFLLVDESDTLSQNNDRPSVNLLQDPEGRLAQLFRLDRFPAWVIIDQDGQILFLHRGAIALNRLETIIRNLAVTGQPNLEQQEQFQLARQRHQNELRLMAQRDIFLNVSAEQQLPAKAHLAPPQAPSSVSLEERWVLRSLSAPGNISVMPGPNGPQLLIPCEGNALAVIDRNGHLLEKSRPQGLKDDELLTLVRVGQDQHQRPLIGLSSMSGRAVHLYDSAGTTVETLFPASLKQGQATGRIITDFQFYPIPNQAPAVLLAELDLDRRNPLARDALRFAHQDSARQWCDENVSSPYQIDCFRNNDQDTGIYCLDHHADRSVLTAFHPDGTRRGVIVPYGPDSTEWQILWFRCEQLTSEPKTDLCAILADVNGTKICIAGLEPDGKIAWSCPFPRARFRYPIERILAGDFSGNGNKEWIIPTPNGSVLVIRPDGTLLDRFAFGEYLAGMAILEINENRLLIVSNASTPSTITAWEIVTID